MIKVREMSPAQLVRDCDEDILGQSERAYSFDNCWQMFKFISDYL